MTDDLADKLLDAQVEFILSELTGDRLAEVVARDVHDVLAVADTMILAEVVDKEQIKKSARLFVDRIGAGPIHEPMIGAFADAIYGLSASDDYHLKDVIDREPVEELIAKIISMHTLHDRALDRLAESPLVATVASAFVNKIVGDFIDTNRKRAEKLPGMSTMMAIGQNAASRMKTVSDGLLGDVAGKGAQFALRSSTNAIRDLIRSAPLQDAAMEIWDLHADEPVSGLREYLSRQDLSELALIVHRIAITTRNKEYFGHVLDECIDVFFENYGKHSLASLLPEVGIDHDLLVGEILAYAPPVIEQAKRDGVLAAQIRTRLAPFFHSAEVAALLGQ